MNRKLFVSFFLLANAFSALAEENTVHVNKFKDNWFVGAGFGVQEFIGNPKSDLSFNEMLTPFVNVYVGKWLTPSSGLRLGYNGATFKNNEGEDTPYYDIHGDYMLNVHNLLFGYKQMRTWELSPYIGAGWAASRGDFKNDGFSVCFGLYNTFRFTNALFATLDLQANMADKEFDLKISGDEAFDKLCSASVGVGYRFKKRGWDVCSVKNVNVALLSDDEYEAQLKADSASVAEKKAQEEELARLKSQLNECVKKQNDLMTEIKEEKAKQANGIANLSEIDKRLTTKTVFFTAASTTVANKYMVDMKPLVAFAQKNGCKLKVTGYADNATGTSEFNRSLSQKRADAVASLLEKLGMAKSDLIVTAEGGTMIANDMKYNRRVTVELEK